LVGTCLGLFLTPLLFVIFQFFQEKMSGKVKDDTEWEF
jgi:hypothetical protein